MNTFRNQKGFTLVEVIISIAILGIVSGVVLKLFVLSNDISNKVRVEDLAALYSSNAIEISKEYKSPRQITQNLFFNQGNISVDNEQEKCTLFYDENWNKIMNGGKFKLTLIIKKVSGNELLPISINDEDSTKIKSSLYDIQVIVEEKHESGYKTIVNYITSKYYVFEE